MTGREKRGLRPRTLVSGWFWTGLGLTIALCVTLSLAAAHAADMIGRSVALVMLGVAVILCAMLLSETVLRVDRKGFRTLLRRCIPWADVTRIEVREVTRWGSFTFAPVIDRQPDAAGRPRRVILQGFGEPGRPERLEDLRATLQQYRDAATPPTERTPSTEKPSRPPTARRTPN